MREHQKENIKKFCFRINSSLHKKIKSQCVLRGITIQEFMENKILNIIESEVKKDPDK